MALIRYPSRGPTRRMPKLFLPCPARACPRACDLARPAPLARPAGAEQPAPDPGLSRGGRQTTQARLIAAAERQHCPPFQRPSGSDRLVSARQSRLGGAGEWPNRLTVLARALRRHGEKTPGWATARQGYRPPSPCRARRARPPGELPAPDFLLGADRFCLYQSVSTPDGVHYEPLACWPCGSRQRTAPRAHP